MVAAEGELLEVSRVIWAGPKEAANKHELTRNICLSHILAPAAWSLPRLFRITGLTASQTDWPVWVPVICSRVRSSRLAKTVAEGHTRHLLEFALKWIQSSPTAGKSYRRVPEVISYCLPATTSPISERVLGSSCVGRLNVC